MKAFVEIVTLNVLDVITTSGGIACDDNTTGGAVCGDD